MNPTDILFSTISQLTGGLVSDLQTVIVAMLVIGFIIMGFDYIREALESNHHARQRDNAYGDAKTYHANERAYRDQGKTVEADLYRAKYRAAIRRASQ